MHHPSAAAAIMIKARTLRNIPREPAAAIDQHFTRMPQVSTVLFDPCAPARRAETTRACSRG
jgi:hypothetical protein